MMSAQAGGAAVRTPRFGFTRPDKMCTAVLLPMPFVPSKPRTAPGRGDGRPCSANAFSP